MPRSLSLVSPGGLQVYSLARARNRRLFSPGLTVTLCELNELLDQSDEDRRLIFLAKVTRIM
jgi:hypothetical protein